MLVLVEDMGLVEMRIKNFKRFILITVMIVFMAGILILLHQVRLEDEIIPVIDNVEVIDNETALLEDEKVNNIRILQEQYQNSDIKGIISIAGEEEFKYPIVQGIDNEYYLNHNYQKEKDAYGSIYFDYRVNLDSSKKFLIYGHNSTRRNVPFNKLENYYDEEYYQKHKYITLETETNIYRYEIFSVYVETNDFTYMNMNFDNDEEWYLHLLKIQNKSFYVTDVQLSAKDNILIIQTCSNHPNYSKYSKKYLLIVSRRV